MRITKPKERWFHVPDDPDEGKVLIRHLTPGERQDIFDRTMPQKVEYESDGQGSQVPVFSLDPDRATERDLTLKACVIGWEGFYDEDGAVMECTPDNIVKARREIEGFFEFITECRTVLDESILLEHEVQEKN